MPPRDLDAPCSRFYRYRDLIECGETSSRLAARGSPESNLPRRAATWRAIELVARAILDPVAERFGKIQLTYGFAGRSLTRHIGRGISPTIDQHAGHELGRALLPICRRLGQAVDFIVPGVSSIDVALWARTALPFDRIYVYGDKRAIHISHGPEMNASVFAMVPRGERVIPRRVCALDARALHSLLSGS